jgi:hypothetical protein
LTNLDNAYASWNKGYGNDLTKEEYFAKLEALPEPGRAVKSIIEHLRGKGVVN